MFSGFVFASFFFWLKLSTIERKLEEERVDMDEKKVNRLKFVTQQRKY